MDYNDKIFYKNKRNFFKMKNTLFYFGNFMS